MVFLGLSLTDKVAASQNNNMPELVDVIFLDIDGVLLPFGDATAKTKNDDDCFVDGCLFPNRTMKAFTALLSHLASSCVVTDVVNDDNKIIQSYAYNPKIVLSSTWRTRSDFIQDILSSFRAYAAAASNCSAAIRGSSWNARHLLNNGRSFFDITDPKYFATRHEEIYKWVQSNAYNRRSRAQYKNIIFRSWIALDDEDIVHVEDYGGGGGGVTIIEDAKKHAVKTISSIGLTVTDVELGIALLEKQILDYHSHHPTTTKE